MNIRWGNTVSSSFHFTNGIKQGGIISSVLFNVYMDDRSIYPNNSGIGGDIVEKNINHLCYAVDICLFALSSSAMQQLLNICHTYSTEHSLFYNGKKSFPMCLNIYTFLFQCVLGTKLQRVFVVVIGWGTEEPEGARTLSSAPV